MLIGDGGGPILATPRTRITTPTPVPEAAPQAPHDSSSCFLSALSDNWGNLGFDDKGDLSQGKIDSLMENPSLKGSQAAEVAELKNMSNGKGVTESQLESYAKTEQKDPTLDGGYDYYQQRVGDESSKLFANGQPSPDAINQGQLGDCYFLSSVSGEAKLDPSGVVNMITDDQDGHYTVKFPGQQNAVTIAGPTEAEEARGCDSGQDGTWAAVLEKAYGVSRSSSNASDPYQAIENGGTTQGLQTMTGGDIKSVGLDQKSSWFNPFSWGNSDKNDRSNVEKAISSGQLATVATSGSVDGVPGDHMLTLEGYDPTTDTVTIRNPWGSEPANSNVTDLGNGNFSMKFDQFDKTFTTLDYQQKSI
jgi:hypothetical protein